LKKLRGKLLIGETLEQDGVDDAPTRYAS